MRLIAACLSLCGALCFAAAATAATVPLSTVVSLDAGAGEFTEGLTVDHGGNLYVGLAFQGRILKIAPDGTRSIIGSFPIGDGLIVGLAVDDAGNVYAAVDSFDANQGIWRVSRTGAVEQYAALASSGFPNGLAFDDQGNLYVTDSSLGTIWRIDRRTRAVTQWLSSPLLAGDPIDNFGANGIAFWHGDAYVSNSDRSSIVRVPMETDGTAGTPAVYVADPALGYADGIAFDPAGNLYVASSSGSNTLERVGRDGTVETLATAADGLDYTASVAFGTSHGEHGELYFTNAGVSFGTPSVMQVDVGG
jgi:sugar lactone lactonase YvrE